MNPDNQYLTDTRKLIIIYGIVSAMSYLHSHDVLHRDLKPDNVLLDDFLFPKVADFGLSKSEHKKSLINETAAGTIKGTPTYISPEIWEKGEYSKKSDVYAFGIVLFEIMTLQKPFSNIDIFRLQISVHRGQRPEFDVEIPAVYKSLIERCWSQNPKERPTFDQILVELKINHEFITKEVNEEQYLRYVNYIENSNISFDSFKVIIKTKEDDIQLINVMDDFLSNVKHFPYKYFKKIDEENRILVKEADSGVSDKQFEIARNLIEVRHGFPIDSKVGLFYLKKSVVNGHQNSLLYYINMLIKGNIIPSDYKEAQQLIENKFEVNGSLYLFLYGKFYKKFNRYFKARECFKRSMKQGNVDSLYEYAELLRKGRCKPQNHEEIDKYYKEAADKGNLNAIFRYGILHKDKEEGKRLIKLAADKGCLKALHYYGTQFDNEEYLKKAS